MHGCEVWGKREVYGGMDEYKYLVLKVGIQDWGIPALTKDTRLRLH